MPRHPEPAAPPFEERLVRHLAVLYGAGRAPAVATDLAAVVARFTARGDGPPPRSAPWDEGDAVLITYGDTLQAPGEFPLATLGDFLRRHLGDAFSLVHLLPIFPFSSDDGFAVVDYREVRPELGDWGHVAALRRDYDLMLDLVLNHCSRESLWFADYVNDVAPCNGYFLEVDPGANLSLVTRPRTTPLLTEVRTHRGTRHLWATFSHDQLDLNFANPAVLLEFVDILLEYVARGARVVRLDAIAYLWKEPGTPCIHLPQTHEVVRLLRTIVDRVAPNTLLLTETNVPNAENRSYFGTAGADGRGDEAHLIYQFSLPPLLLHGLHTGSTRYLTEWAMGLAAEAPPRDCTTLNFSASHDGIGLRPLEGLVPEEEVALMLEAMRARGGYISSRRRPDGSEAPYELNISLFDAFRDPGNPHDPWQLPAFRVGQLVTLSMQGIPALYIHSLTATPNDHAGVERTGRTRSINRRSWDRGELERLLADGASATARVFRNLTHALGVRRRHPAFHPDGPQEVLLLGYHLFGVARTAPDASERVLCLFNFTPEERSVSLDERFWDAPPGTPWRDLLTGTRARSERGRLVLPPYAGYWLVAES